MSLFIAIKPRFKPSRDLLMFKTLVNIENGSRTKHLMTPFKLKLISRRALGDLRRRLGETLQGFSGQVISHDDCVGGWHRLGFGNDVGH